MAEEGTGGSGTAKITSDNLKLQSDFNELIRQSAAKQELLNDLAAERNELLNQTSEKLKDELNTMDRILTLSLNQIKDFDKLAKAEADRKKALEDNRELLETMAEAIQDASEGTEAHIKAVEAYEKAVKKVTAQFDKQIEKENLKHNGLMLQFEKGQRLHKLAELNLEIKDKEGNLIKGQMKDLIENAKSQAEIRNILESAAGYIELTEDLQRKMDGHSEKIAGSLGLSSKFASTTLGSFVGQVKQYQQLSDAGMGMRKILEASFLQSFNMLNVFGSLVDIIKDMVVQLDQVGKKLGASTGMGNIFQSQIMTTFNATVRGGGTMEEASAAIGSLATGFSKFDPEAEKVNETLATTVVRLGKIGIGGAEAVKTMDFFVRTLRMTEEQSAELTTELALMGQQMGLTSAQIIGDFAKVSSDLSVYGKGAMDVFKDLEAQAKATGMEISSLVNIAKQFDTFDTAADKAAQLNAVLGTQLSSLEMMNMKYDDRVNYLRQEVSFAVGNLDGMDQYTQQFVAQALGVSSVAEAQKLLNMNQQEYLKYQGDMAAAKKREEDLAELTQQLVPIMQQFKIALLQIGTALKGPISLFSTLLGIIGPYFDVLLYGFGIYKMITAATLAFNIVKSVELMRLLGTGSATKAEFAAKAASLGITISQATAAKVLTVANTILAFSTNTLSGAFTTLNISMGAVAIAFLVMAAIFASRINPLFIQVFSFMAVGVLALAVAFGVLNYSGGSLVLGLFVALGAAVALLVYSMRDLFEQMIESAPAFLQAGLGLYVVAGGIAAIALAMALLGPLGFLGLAVLSLSLTQMGNAFEKIAGGLERISKISSTLSNLGNNGIIAISSEGNKINAVMGTGDVMNNFSAGKMEVEVKMPKMETPKIELKVELMGRQLEAFVKEVINKG